VGILGFVGGTGPEGLGLALRLSAAGERLLIGSRTVDRAAAAAARIRAAVPGARVEAQTNHDVLARADTVALTLPYAALAAFLGEASDALRGRLVIDVIVPVAVEDGRFGLAPVPGARSVGELIQQRAPGARVVSAFKNLSAASLQDLTQPLEGDVVLCGNEPAARAEVARLVRLVGLRPVDAGSLVNARYIEAITPLLLNLNRRHRARTSVAILGLGHQAPGSASNFP